MPSSCFEVDISVMPRDEADELGLGPDIKLKSAFDLVLLSRAESKLLCVADDLAKLEEDDTEARWLLLVVRLIRGDDDIISDGAVVREDGPCWGLDVETSNLDTKCGWDGFWWIILTGFQIDIGPSGIKYIYLLYGVIIDGCCQWVYKLRIIVETCKSLIVKDYSCQCNKLIGAVCGNFTHQVNRASEHTLNATRRVLTRVLPSDQFSPSKWHERKNSDYEL